MIPDVTLSQLLQRIAAAAIVLAVYGFVTTWAIRRVGDRGPAYDGRLTLNPLAHLDIVGLLAIIFFRVGWIRPLDFDSREFARPRIDGLIVIAISSLAMLLVATAALFARQIVFRTFEISAGLAITGVLSAAADIAVRSAMLGLLPIPPLMGVLLWSAARPGSESHAKESRVKVVGVVAVVALLLSGWIAPLLAWGSLAFRQLLGFA